jgi:hypothetical protein
MRRRPPEEAAAPSLRVHGWASGSAPRRTADDVVDRIGAGLRTPRRYDKQDDSDADPRKPVNGRPRTEH